MQRLPREPELSYLGACLWALSGREGRDRVEACSALYGALAPGADPAQVRALVEADASDWDWSGRSAQTTESRLLTLLEQAYTSCATLLSRVEPITVAEGTSLGRLVVQLARTHEMILERRPPAASSSADYGGLSDADLETLRGILDRAQAARGASAG